MAEQSYKATDGGDVWVIHLVAIDDGGPPTEIRVRRFLKSALRSFGLRCVRVTGETSSANQSAGESTPEALAGIRADNA